MFDMFAGGVVSAVAVVIYGLVSLLGSARFDCFTACNQQTYHYGSVGCVCVWMGYGNGAHD